MWRWRGWRGSKERDEVLLQLIQGAKLVLTLEATTNVSIARVSQGMCKRRETAST